MAKDKMMLYSFRVPPKLIDEYRQFCDENCMDVSKRLRRYMERDIENWKRTKIAKYMAQKAKEEREKSDNDIDDIDEDELFS